MDNLGALLSNNMTSQDLTMLINQLLSQQQLQQQQSQQLLQQHQQHHQYQQQQQQHHQIMQEPQEQEQELHYDSMQQQQSNFDNTLFSVDGGVAQWPTSLMSEDMLSAVTGHSDLIEQHQSQFKMRLRSSVDDLSDSDVQLLMLQEQNSFLKSILDGSNGGLSNCGGGGNGDGGGGGGGVNIQPTMRQAQTASFEPIPESLYIPPPQQAQQQPQATLHQPVVAVAAAAAAPQPLPPPQTSQVIERPPHPSDVVLFETMHQQTLPYQSISKLQYETACLAQELEQQIQQIQQQNQHQRQQQQQQQQQSHQQHQVPAQQHGHQIQQQQQQHNEIVIDSSPSTSSSSSSNDNSPAINQSKQSHQHQQSHQQQSHQSQQHSAPKTKCKSIQSKDYRQRKKDHISVIEQKLKELSMENQRLKQENMTMKNVSLADMMRPDDFHQATLDFQALLVKLAQNVINNNNCSDKSIEYLLQFFEFSSKLRSTVVERDIEKVINPTIQAKLYYLGYRPSAEISVICGNPMVTTMWWPSFMDQVGINEQQRNVIESLWKHYAKIQAELKDERDQLDEEIKKMIPIAKRTREFDPNLFNNGYGLYQQQPPLQTLPSITLDIVGNSVSANTKPAQANQPYGLPNRQAPVPGKAPPHDSDRATLTVAQVLEFCEKLERMRMNFIRHRQNICYVDMAITKILTPIQNAKLILQVHKTPFMDIALVDQITMVWGKLYESPDSISNLIPKSDYNGVDAKFNILDNSDHQYDKLKSVYETLYQSFSTLEPLKSQVINNTSSSSSTLDKSSD
ncbi:hypothetical protein SAMD00019534_018570 [Acytostelium subglobosum LB1]|uniref:hypothetical protein n=1 Tax=Acytostelium subglobosum LB1 TaxID=1410327 RepID=UPI00064485C1|nr:hypothetical protein SAMD00019534_018570 [Acytostelium subglobosum LB1]GAM18682.1 hypothetical protein SAMD00019534_018570 [Acytostelium subglobosum LB1]|eukprot:XP_012757902.1 hypothetical protein SAMD00019534_018570 [Acytostelium subglobosum LB1]